MPRHRATMVAGIALIRLSSPLLYRRVLDSGNSTGLVDPPPPRIGEEDAKQGRKDSQVHWHQLALTVRTRTGTSSASRRCHDIARFGLPVKTSNATVIRLRSY